MYNNRVLAQGSSPTMGIAYKVYEMYRIMDKVLIKKANRYKKWKEWRV
jgi:hypothetical protein